MSYLVYDGGTRKPKGRVSPETFDKFLSECLLSPRLVNCEVWYTMCNDSYVCGDPKIACLVVHPGDFFVKAPSDVLFP